jgi:hypothetical protein
MVRVPLDHYEPKVHVLLQVLVQATLGLAGARPGYLQQHKYTP